MATTTVSPSQRAAGIGNSAAGKFTGDGNDIIVNLGFVPSFFKLINETDAVVWEKLGTNTAADAVKIDTAAAIDTNALITFNANGTVTISATAAPNAKVMAYYASV